MHYYLVLKQEDLVLSPSIIRVGHILRNILLYSICITHIGCRMLYHSKSAHGTEFLIPHIIIINNKKTTAPENSSAVVLNLNEKLSAYFQPPPKAL